ncbi:MAG TPA: PQQ-binding-like beta-propeller repeat protein [Pyrinomonadaceae bacterium]|jgi:outer membrane protein assembly factor BamB|nr:PQQ-binding-like beta-propeller repeat protein [Pyrinomonadaceae bacterium]
MRHRTVHVIAIVLFSITITYADNWPQWRGPSLNGVSTEKNLPAKWTTEENIAWKLAMPERSGSTPIIWRDRIFLNVAEGNDLYLWCVDRTKATMLWKKLLGSGNVRMRKQNMSSPSPVTDGKTVYVMTGTGILKAFDFAGKELWMRDIQKEYGQFGLNWGYASSPLLFEDSLYVQVLHGMKTDDPSYVMRINRTSGKTIWKVDRPTTAIRESPDAYTTPALLRYGKTTEIVIAGADCVTGHDPATGKELWRANGLNPNNDPSHRIVASPIIFNEIIYAPTRVRPLLAFKAGGRGDISTSHLLWSTTVNGPDVPTPVTDGKYFYLVNDRGIMWCLDAKTGTEIYGQQRLKPGTYSGSLVLADDKLYITNEEGLTSVIKAGPKFEVIAENPLNDYCLSSPAISDGQIFIRTETNLYCIGKK